MKRFIDRLPLSFTPQALLYPILLIGSLLFAQGLKSPVSHAVFIFVLLLPAGTAIQLIIAALTIRVSFRVSVNTPRKRYPFVVNAYIKNTFVMPFSLVEASISLPDKYGEKSEDIQFLFPLLPFSVCRIDRSVEFAFRGEHRIGVNCIYVYDLMRAVRLRIPTKRYADLFVLPRVITLEDSCIQAPGDQTLTTASLVKGNDNTETEDVRSYRDGDNLKAIHWKLSSKSEELLVKEYADDNQGVSVVLCAPEPFSAVNSHSDIVRTVKSEYADTVDLYCADLAIELSLAVVRQELENNSEVVLAWLENGIPTVVNITDESDFDHIYRRFAAIHTDNTVFPFSLLAESLTNISCASLTMISPIIDSDHIKDCLAASSVLNAETMPKFRLCAAECMFEKSANDDLHQRIRELEKSGIEVITVRNN